MRIARRFASSYLCALVVVFVILFPTLTHAGNEVMGELQFEGKSKVEKTSGVWVDGQYVGYLKELKGSKKVLLLPGEHTISVRQNGYQDFTQTVVLRPGEKRVLQVAMTKAASGPMPAAWASVKIAVNPNRAAVFMDGRFVGHVGEFDGVGRSLLVAPGQHSIKIALPGFKTFDTQINPTANQKVEVKTDLVKNDVPADDPSLKSGASATEDHAPPPPPEPTGSPQR
jgi:hypothetical protein